MEYIIEKNVPLPSKISDVGGRPRNEKYNKIMKVVDQLKPNESFIVDLDRKTERPGVIVRIKRTYNNTNKSFTVRKANTGYRIFRIS